MSLVDDNSQDPPSDAGESVGPSQAGTEPASSEPHVLPGDPIAYVGAAAPAKEDYVPEDLRIGWSWVHLLVFGAFFFVMQFAIATVIIGYYSVFQHLTQKQLRQLLESDPKLLVGTSVASFGLILLFLYVTLSALHGRPFWR